MSLSSPTAKEISYYKSCDIQKIEQAPDTVP